MLGVPAVCIISHGSSQAPSIFNAIRVAKEAIDHEIVDRIQHYQTSGSLGKNDNLVSKVNQ